MFMIQVKKFRDRGIKGYIQNSITVIGPYQIFNKQSAAIVLEMFREQKLN